MYCDTGDKPRRKICVFSLHDITEGRINANWLPIEPTKHYCTADLAWQAWNVVWQCQMYHADVLWTGCTPRMPLSLPTRYTQHATQQTPDITNCVPHMHMCIQWLKTCCR